jgi:hypothetical protein
LSSPPSRSSHTTAPSLLEGGPAQEFTALAVLERPLVTLATPASQRRPPYALRHLRRFPPGTPYLDVAQAVGDLLAAPGVTDATVVIDQTGVGTAVVGLVAEALPVLPAGGLFPVCVTTGAGVVEEGGVVSVPRAELAGVLPTPRSARMRRATARPSIRGRQKVPKN